MDLIPEDLQRLYGDRFYMVPGDLPNPKETTEKGSKGSEGVPSSQKVKKQPEKETAPATELSPTGKLIWRPKPSSQVLFVLHQSELREKELTDLLKKIVESIKIPFDAAGFGVITGEINAADFQKMPNPHGVVFDSSLQFGEDNPAKVEGGDNIDGGTLYFTHRLSELKDDKALKKALWEQLQEIQKKLV